jgi:CBS domain-containing protein
LRELRPRRQVAPLTVTTATAVDEVIAELPRHGGIAVVTDPQQGPVGVVTIADLARAARLTQAGWQHRGGKPADD